LFDDLGAFRAIGGDQGCPDGGSPSLVDRRQAVRMEALERDASVLFPGAVEAIQRSAAAVPIAIASGALGADRRVLDGAT
jgi:hypothetical protein